MIKAKRNIYRFISPFFVGGAPGILRLVSRHAPKSLGSRLVWCLACALALGLDYIYFHFLDRKSNRHIFSIFWCLANQDILRWQTFLSLQLLSPPTQTHTKKGVTSITSSMLVKIAQSCADGRDLGLGVRVFTLKKLFLKFQIKNEDEPIQCTFVIQS